VLDLVALQASQCVTPQCSIKNQELRKEFCFIFFLGVLGVLGVSAVPRCSYHDNRNAHLFPFRERSAGRRKRLSNRRSAARKRTEIMPALMQDAHHLNPVPAGAIHDGVRVSPDDFMAGAFTHAFGPDQGIPANGSRGSLDRSEHPIGGGNAELRVVCFDSGDILYRSR
jgi:hypothetical protein